ncbi:hypothetical protein GGR56DRAFT_696512 [Xylariaceae sp. FL0804]|nr:hypothetical protein GGR56DRAFT_696512 [Xylariaceae sp. FL0804]
MALPLAIHNEEDHAILFFSDSEEDDVYLPPGNPAPRHDTPRATTEESARALRQKTKEAAANVPLHPIPAMQPAFTESLVEASTNTAELKPKLRFGDAKQRRAHLLDGAKGSGLHAALWRYRPGQKHHELWKLLSQISFGVYLLLNGIANSNEQVVTILQGHIDEVDEFLETTLEDINVALDEVKERIDFLKLPMENVSTFERMLEDRNFRLQIVTGNVKIEHIINRTTAFLDFTFQDVEEGLKATKEFAVYLGDQQERQWRQQRPELGEIFDAMKGNAQGWYKAFIDLQDNASALDTLLIRLGQMVAEMDQRAGEVSRRTRVSVPLFVAQGEAKTIGPCSLALPPTPARRTRPSPTSSSRRPSATHSGTTSPGGLSHSSQPTSPLAREKGHVLKPQSSRPRMVDIKQDRSREAVVRAEDRVKPVQELKPVQEVEKPPEDEGLYLLQPRTYTPQPPSPQPQAPSPQPQASSPQLSALSLHIPAHFKQEEQPKRTSLRQRVSLKGGNLPEVIHVPPRNAPELQEPRYHELEAPRNQSPRYQSPRNYQVPDSAYGSDADMRVPFRVIDPVADASPPKFPNTIPSPRSDQQQYFYPVRASPHSPLQQRPWTATMPPRPHTAQAGHHRNQPSAMGMSMLSNVTTITQGGTKLKKKRSAFGWLKKAFTLDEEERAQFENRIQSPPTTATDNRSPKFLDGRRIPEYRRYQ